VKNGIVTLTGRVPSYAQKSAAARATARVAGAKAVVNELQVGLPPADQRTDEEVARADVLSEHGGGFMLTQMCVRRIPKSGRTPDDVLGYLGLSAEDIIKTALEMVVVGHDR
jgi:BON domain-containing protein